MPARVNDGGVWKAGTPYVNDGGVWKQVRQLWVNNGGTWQIAHSASLGFSPAPGDYGDVGSYFSVTAGAPTTWSYSPSSSLGMAVSQSPTGIRFSLTAPTSGTRTVVVTLTANGSTWTFTLSATGSGNQQ